MARFSAAVAGRAGSLLLLLAIWEAAARLVDSRLFPGAGEVLGALFDDTVRGELLHHLSATLLRVAIAFAAAMVVGTAVGIIMGLVRALDTLFDSWVVLFLNLPALVIAVLLYIWLGLTDVAAITAVAISKFPTVVVTLREGTRALDQDLAGMAESFRLGALRTLRHVILPQLSPYLLVAARSGLALIWKIVLVVELLGRPDGIGYEIQVFFQLFDIKRLIAYALAFVAVVLAIEWCVLLPLERRLLRWRG